LQEKWMSPIDSCDKDGCGKFGCGRSGCDIADEFTLRNELTKRFGADKMEELVGVFQDTWIKESDLDLLQNLGLTLVRLPIYYRDLMDDEGNWKQGNIWRKIDWLVEECSKRGIYVLLDLHGAFGCQNTFDNCGHINDDPLIWKITKYQEWTAKLWTGMADHFKGNPAIFGYDLLNEPDRVDKEPLNKVYDILYKAIRISDPDHMIIIEDPDFTYLPHPKAMGWSNVVYSKHIYNFGGWDDGFQQNLTAATHLEGMRLTQMRHNVPVYAGEFSLFEDLDVWENFLTQMNALDISWTHWSYKMWNDYANCNWAYFHNNKNSLPNIKEDSAEVIKQKWLKFGTENFQPNEKFQKMISKCAKGDNSQPSTPTYQPSTPTYQPSTPTSLPLTTPTSGSLAPANQFFGHFSLAFICIVISCNLFRLQILN
jgi:endoglucanase